MLGNEFKKMYLGLNPSLTNKKRLPQVEIPHSDSIPDEFDWRDHNAVTPVKNQVLQCYIILVLIIIILMTYLLLLLLIFLNYIYEIGNIYF